jgi:hypothetical protein
MNSLLFGINAFALNKLENGNNDRSKQSLLNIFIAGSISGFSTCLPNTPLELIKTQLQTHSNFKQIS